MKRITVTVPDELSERMEQERRRREISTADLIREALNSYLPAVQSERDIPFAALGRSGRGDIAGRAEELLYSAGGAPKRLPFIGLGRSGYTDTARNIDAILYERP